MRAALLLAALLSVALATPEGYYHQEYNYKTSSSAFKNNELQHKTDDEGYYSKDGDLEGRTRPKVKANSEHSEYVNPKLQTNAGYYDAGTDLTSHGNMMANSYGYGGAGGSASSGYQASSGYSAGSSSSNYGSSIQSIVSSIQNDFLRDLQYGQYYQNDIANLEEELRRNLTARLNEMLQQRYGSQTIRGGQSYSLVGGRLEARPNYEQQELEALRQRAEQSLLDKLRQEYNVRRSHQSSYSREDYQRYQQTTTYRPRYDQTTVYVPRYEQTTYYYRPPSTTYATTTYRPLYPNLNVDNNLGYSSNTQQQSSHYSSNKIEYTQVPSTVSLTTIASNVQSELNNRLNRLLEEAQRQYFSEYSRNTIDTAPILERLEQELRRNLTYSFDEELRRHFGTQFQRDGYMFSSGASNEYNYNQADYENLRRQVEDNLLQKLKRDFEAARQHWITRQQHLQTQKQYQGSQNFYGQGQTNQFDGYNRLDQTTVRYDYYRPTSASIIPLISSGVSRGQGSHGTLVSGSSYHQVEGTASASNVAELEQRLQSELSNQLKAALSQNVAHMRTYSGSTDRSQFEEVYRRMFDDMQRNLTQQLQGYQGGYGSVSEAQLAGLKSQLQQNLATELQQGLQQSFSASSSYSASSSHSSSGAAAYGGANSGSNYYRQARGSQAQDQFGQYRSGGNYHVPGDDCDDTNYHYRAKRSYGYRSTGGM